MTGYYSPQLGEPDHDDDDEHDEDEDEDDLGYQVGQRGQSLTGRGGWGALHDAVHPQAPCEHHIHVRACQMDMRPNLK